jgi:hypothetical protein
MQVRSKFECRQIQGSIDSEAPEYADGMLLPVKAQVSHQGKNHQQQRNLQEPQRPLQLHNILQHTIGAGAAVGQKQYAESDQAAQASENPECLQRSF